MGESHLYCFAFNPVHKAVAHWAENTQLKGNWFSNRWTCNFNVCRGEPAHEEKETKPAENRRTVLAGEALVELVAVERAVEQDDCA